ncbi:hypothetical protein Tco_1262363 [Tanacetum coccineum]
MALHLLHRSKDLPTMILLSKTAAGVAVGRNRAESAGALMILHAGGFREIMQSDFLDFAVLWEGLNVLRALQAHLQYCAAVLGTRSEVRRTRGKCAVL